MCFDLPGAAFFGFLFLSATDFSNVLPIALTFITYPLYSLTNSSKKGLKIGLASWFISLNKPSTLVGTLLPGKKILPAVLSLGTGPLSLLSFVNAPNNLLNPVLKLSIKESKVDLFILLKSSLFLTL